MDEEAEFERLMQGQGRTQKLAPARSAPLPPGRAAPGASSTSNRDKAALEALRQDLAATQAVAARLEAEKLAANAANGILTKERAEARQALEESRKGLAALEGDARRSSEAQKALDRHLGEARGVNERLERELKLADKESVWLRRGFDLPASRVAALRAALEREPERTVAAVTSAGPTLLEDLLKRIVLSCDAPTCVLQAHFIRVPVASAACEICGGSSVARGFVEFADACRESGFAEVMIVGGSQAYDETLRNLHRDHARDIRLKLTRALTTHERDRARSAKGLVIVWGATEVDHTKTAHYRDAGALSIIVSHRGISGMLEKAAAELRRRLASPRPR